ncbi:PLP-dependent aminotransferase family protein [Kaistia sp. UC242_56]|uniref:PLP-dependent aminotransferase family protein n=1 Tax=Kaistia sp. UC242_56 TaxID=3374625 RepID=UPI0037A3E33A
MGRSPSIGPGSPRWSPRLEEASPSKHQGIFDALVADIASGRLRPGDRLPPQRAVAAALGVDLTTVTKAYSRAREEGIIDATTGRGSFVAGEPRPASTLAGVAAGAIDLSKNSPPKPQDFQRVLARDIGQALSGSDESLLDYQETGGSWTNRSAGATWLSQRVDGCAPDRVILASGAQSALFAICHLLCRASRHVAVGEFCYPGIHTVAVQQDLVLVPLAMDGEGILPAAFEDACRLQSLDALYITPTADNPTTASLSELRRQEIVRIARKHAVSIIEDDPYGALLDTPPTAIASLGPEHHLAYRDLIEMPDAGPAFWLCRSALAQTGAGIGGDAASHDDDGVAIAGRHRHAVDPFRLPAGNVSRHRRRERRPARTRRVDPLRNEIGSQSLRSPSLDVAPQTLAGRRFCPSAGASRCTDRRRFQFFGHVAILGSRPHFIRCCARS